MSGEIIAIIGVGCALAGLLVGLLIWLHYRLSRQEERLRGDMPNVERNRSPFVFSAIIIVGCLAVGVVLLLVPQNVPAVTYSCSPIVRGVNVGLFGPRRNFGGWVQLGPAEGNWQCSSAARRCVVD